MFSVYKHTNLINSKVYIGITKQNPEDRWMNGFGYKTNKHFYSSIKKYGWDNFSHDIIYNNLTMKEAKQKEIELISRYNATNPKFGYNHSVGGDYINKTGSIYCIENDLSCIVNKYNSAIDSAILNNLTEYEIIKICEYEFNGSEFRNNNLSKLPLYNNYYWCYVKDFNSVICFFKIIFDSVELQDRIHNLQIQHRKYQKQYIKDKNKNLSLRTENQVMIDKINMKYKLGRKFTKEELQFVDKNEEIFIKYFNN